jgi:acyl carrier protein
MMKQDSRDPIPFEEFRRVIAQELQMEEGKIVREASLVNDLHADSIQLVELMLRMEEMGIEIPIEAAWDIETVGDAYQVYRRHVVQRA